MSVVIKGMEMPKDCCECPLSAWHYESFRSNGKYVVANSICVLTVKTITSTKRNRFCPLVEKQESE